MSVQERMSARAYLEKMGVKKPASKYKNKKKVIEGIEFDSTKEARKWQDLVLQQMAGQITELERQVSFPLVVNGVLVATYIADWRYRRGDKSVVGDCKGVKTDVYLIKRKLMLACYRIEIEEV